MRLSSGMLAVLSVFDNSFSNTKLSLAFAGRNGFIVEEFIYDGDVLTEIKITRSKAKPDSQTEEHKFVYENHKLIQIERICQNGYRELKYTTKNLTSTRSKKIHINPPFGRVASAQIEMKECRQTAAFLIK